ncbi:unnamed protein product [Cyprideis torosa]|uniref:Uncharacterized protein n=1 Tax=Cyprideis torosa TaxID=163714 RepID=A0A7R8W7U7_9CRUS|nr:unnamed protein product [Cyprideis torosa]CAG0882789.1 unnamed protein product [Cyprideis torosa]
MDCSDEHKQVAISSSPPAGRLPAYGDEDGRKAASLAVALGEWKAREAAGWKGMRIDAKGVGMRLGGDTKRTGQRLVNGTKMGVLTPEPCLKRKFLVEGGIEEEGDQQRKCPRISRVPPPRVRRCNGFTGLRGYLLNPKCSEDVVMSPLELIEDDFALPPAKPNPVSPVPTPQAVEESGKSYLELGAPRPNMKPFRAYSQQRLLVLNLSMCKLSKYRQVPDLSLHRSVLICNTLKRIEKEMEREGMRLQNPPPSPTFDPPPPSTPPPTDFEERDRGSNPVHGVNGGGINWSSVLSLSSQPGEDLYERSPWSPPPPAPPEDSFPEWRITTQLGEDWIPSSKNDYSCGGEDFEHLMRTALVYMASGCRDPGSHGTFHQHSSNASSSGRVNLCSREARKEAELKQVSALRSAYCHHWDEQRTVITGMNSVLSSLE